MMELIPFAFDDRLVRALWRDDKPWFVGKDVCDVLGIVKVHQALDALDDDERGTCTVGTPGGDQLVIVISEPGVYRLVFRSRKPEAERFKRWLAHEVLPKLRQTGRYSFEPGPDPAPGSESLLHRLQLVREARALFGRDRARALWGQLGLPALPPPPASAMDEAWACLRHLLDWCVEDNGLRIRDLLEEAFEDDEEARVRLVACGVRALPERDAFVVANRHPSLGNIYRASSWPGAMGHMRVLRRLPGTVACGPHRFHGINLRGTLVPAELLDER